MESELTSITYRGRKASRAGSEQRRRAILEAALRIVVREGVRGVRHRAVAREAGVPLSATTYYFSDISDLITDAFTLFVEDDGKRVHHFWEESGHHVFNAIKQLGDSQQALDRFVQSMSELAVYYVRYKVKNDYDILLMERAFELECLTNSNLVDVARMHQQMMMTDLTKFFRMMGSARPDIDARLMQAVVTRAQYEKMLQPSDQPGEDILEPMLERHIRSVVMLARKDMANEANKEQNATSLQLV